MKIINFSAYDRPKSASTRSFDIARGLAYLGHELFFVTNDFCHFERKFHGEKPSKIDGVTCDYLKSPSYKSTLGRLFNSLVNSYRILTYRRISGLDFVIGPSVPITSAFAAYVYAKLNKSQFIFEIRDVWPIALVMLGGLSKINPVYWIYRLIEIFLYRNSHLIITVLPNVSKHVLDVNPNAKIFYIPNPISDDISPLENLQNLPRHNNKGFRKIAYIGGFGIVHDIDTLLQAARYYVNNINDNVEFIFYGNGLKWNSAKMIVRSWGLDDKIKLVGYISKKHALREASRCSVLIAAVPDSPIFNFGINLNKLYLYIAAGVPIAFAGNLPKDIVSENNFGLSVPAGSYVELAKSIHYLISLNSDQRRLIKQRMHMCIKETLSERAISLRYQNILLRNDPKRGKKREIGDKGGTRRA